MDYLTIIPRHDNHLQNNNIDDTDTINYTISREKYIHLNRLENKCIDPIAQNRKRS